jgi:hypothetical protein
MYLTNKNPIPTNFIGIFEKNDTKYPKKYNKNCENKILTPTLAEKSILIHEEETTIMASAGPYTYPAIVVAKDMTSIGSFIPVQRLKFKTIKFKIMYNTTKKNFLKKKLIRKSIVSTQ